MQLQTRTAGQVLVCDVRSISMSNGHEMRMGFARGRMSDGLVRVRDAWVLGIAWCAAVARPHNSAPR